MVKDETLEYYKAKGTGYSIKGPVYIHRWATGYQQLVFCTHEGAARWAQTHGARYIGPAPKVLTKKPACDILFSLDKE